MHTKVGSRWSQSKRGKFPLYCNYRRERVVPFIFFFFLPLLIFAGASVFLLLSLTSLLFRLELIFFASGVFALFFSLRLLRLRLLLRVCRGLPGLGSAIQLLLYQSLLLHFDFPSTAPRFSPFLLVRSLTCAPTRKRRLLLVSGHLCTAMIDRSSDD